MRSRLLSALLAGLALLAGCSSADTAGPEDVAGYFRSFQGDYDPVDTGAELASLVDVVVVAELQAIHPGPTAVGQGEDGSEFRLRNVLFEFIVEESLIPGGPEPGETLWVILWWTGEFDSTPVGRGDTMTAEGRAILYAAEYQQNPNRPFEDWDGEQVLYHPWNPQGFIMEDAEGRTLAVLEHVAALEVSLEDFYPSDEPYPEIG